MLLPSEFFVCNPGLSFKNFSIGFQPEIGSVSVPTLNGFLRFMSAKEIEHGFPRSRHPDANSSTWSFHRFQPWTSRIGNFTYDHVYAYFLPGSSVDAEDWIAASQLAAFAQYQSLFDGFIYFLFEYTSAVIMWKTQSPWPALRGFLYDWFLDSSGALGGVRASLGHPISIVLDQSSWILRIANRQILPLEPCGNSSIGAGFSFFNLNGELVHGDLIHLSQWSVPPMSVAALGQKGLSWPSQCFDVCFLRLEVVGTCSDRTPFPSWHWLTDPSLGIASNYSMLGALRARQNGLAKLDVVGCTISQSGLTLNILVSVDRNTEEILFYPRFDLFYVHHGRLQQILPVFDSRDSDIVLLPGTNQSRSLESAIPFKYDNHDNKHVKIVMTSWNGPKITMDTLCVPIQPSSVKKVVEAVKLD